MAAVLPEDEKRARRRRLVIILVVAGVMLGGFLILGRLRSSALDDKADAAIADLRPAWRELDLSKLQDAYNQATVDANSSGDYSAAIKLFPKSSHATFNSADLSHPDAIAARYSIETWAGDECLDLLVSSPVPNRVKVTTRSGC